MASGPNVDWRVGLVDPTTGVPLVGLPASVVDGADVTQGALADAAVTGDLAGSVNAHLRGIDKLLAAPLTVTGSGNFAVTGAASSFADGAITTLGALADAAVGDATGSLNAHLRQVAKSLGGTLTSAGTLTNNNAAPGAANLGVLPALATAVSPTYTEGDQVLTSVSLSGHLRCLVQGFQGSGVVIASNPIMMGLNGSGAIVRYAVDVTAGFPTTGTGVAAVHSGCFDGTNYQKSLQVSQVTGTTGVGLPSAGPCLWDAVGTTNFVKQAGDGSGRAMVVGAAATGAAVAGNPVLAGGSDGTNAQPLKTDTSGRLLVSGGVAAGSAASSINAVLVGLQDGSNNVNPARMLVVTDAMANGVNGIVVNAMQDDFNGATWDRHRNNIDVTLLASAARTTLQNSANINVFNCKGIIVTVDVTATVSTVSLTPSINYIDPASGKAIPLLTGTTIAAAGTFTYWVDEAALASVPAPFTKTAQAALGRIITINMAVGNANSQTYSIGYTLIP